MKQLKTYLLIGLLSLTFTSTSIFAQNIDANRLNRDIKIMENILGELFKTTLTSSGSNQTYVVSGFAAMSSGNIRGTYLPGFGVIFMVPNSNMRTAFYRSSGQNGNSNSVAFYYDSDSKEEDRTVDEASITSRITEFLKDYASTIGQLKDDEKVMVIYGSTDNMGVRFYTLAGDRQEDKEKLPVISVSAKVGDLKAYRSGSINESAFESKLAKATSEGKEYLDLKVMGNIFETALREQPDDAFRLSGGVNYLMLDNFGALFSFDVRYSDNRFGRDLWGSVARVRQTGAVTVVNGRTVNNDDDARKAEEEEMMKRIDDAYSNLVTNIKEYVVDYGRTLNSLNNDQYLLLSVNVNGRWDEIPNRFDIQVKKSVLQQLDRGTISRDQALNQVVVTEY